MKFLCVPCDSPMKLQTVDPPDDGSLSIVYACPECGYEMAMLTNAYETQVVQSLGVRIGAGRPRAEGDSAGQAEASAGCPFTAMIPGAEEGQRREAPGSPPRVSQRDGVEVPEALPVRWTAAAEARLARIPEFIRPMARTGIERFAREKGVAEVDEQILDAARDFFGM
jgi:Proto-chlorophyllide reductase 57 kD subunit